MLNWATKLIYFLATLAVLPLSGVAASEVETLDTELMLEAPHRYWAKRLVFRDKVTVLPSGKSSKISGNRYYEFTTEALGAVYATEEIRDEILELPIDREYIFGGTILSKGKLLGGAQFFYVVERVVKHLTVADKVQETANSLISAETSQSTEPVIRLLGEILYAGQAGLVSHAMENEFAFEELFTEDSAYAAKIEDTFRSIISGLNRSGSMSPDDILIKLLTSSLNSYYKTEPTLDQNESFVPVEEAASTAIDLEQVFMDEETKAMASEADSMDDAELLDGEDLTLEEPSTLTEDFEMEETAPQRATPAEDFVMEETAAQEMIPSGDFVADETTAEEVIMVEEVEEVPTEELPETTQTSEAPAQPEVEEPKEEPSLDDASLKAETQKWLEELLSEDLEAPQPLDVEP